MLVARLSARTAADAAAHVDPGRLLRDAFAPGDVWFVTGDFFEVDADGDHWLVDRRDQLIRTHRGPAGSPRIEDALYEVPGVALCTVVAAPDPDHPRAAVPVATVQLGRRRRGHLLRSRRASSPPHRLPIAALPEHARPRRLRIVDAIPLTDGFRPIKRPAPRAPRPRPPRLRVGRALAALPRDARRRGPRARPAAPSAARARLLSPLLSPPPGATLRGSSRRGARICVTPTASADPIEERHG